MMRVAGQGAHRVPRVQQLPLGRAPTCPVMPATKNVRCSSSGRRCCARARRAGAAQGDKRYIAPDDAVPAPPVDRQVGGVRRLLDPATRFAARRGRRIDWPHMQVDDAAALIASAVRAAPDAPRAAWWADLGAGRGTFTRALARLLGPSGRVAAVDQDAAAVRALAQLSRRTPAVETAEGEIAAHRADFTDPAALDALGWPPLGGVLLANALHFVPARAQQTVLADLAARLAPGGRLVVVEYEDRRPSPWVPAPVPLARLGALAAGVAAATAPVRVGSRPSAFGGTMYAAYLERVGSG